MLLSESDWLGLVGGLYIRHVNYQSSPKNVTRVSQLPKNATPINSWWQTQICIEVWHRTQGKTLYVLRDKKSVLFFASPLFSHERAALFTPRVCVTQRAFLASLRCVFHVSFGLQLRSRSITYKSRNTFFTSWKWGGSGGQIFAWGRLFIEDRGNWKFISSELYSKATHKMYTEYLFNNLQPFKHL